MSMLKEAIGLYNQSNGTRGHLSMQCVVNGWRSVFGAPRRSIKRRFTQRRAMTYTHIYERVLLPMEAARAGMVTDQPPRHPGGDTIIIVRSHECPDLLVDGRRRVNLYRDTNRVADVIVIDLDRSAS